MAERAPAHVRFTPFRAELVPGYGVNNPLYLYKALLPFRDNNKWIVRINRWDDPDFKVEPVPSSIEKYKIARFEFAQLQQVGVVVPKFHTVAVGPFNLSTIESENFLFYTIEEKVDGENLFEVRFEEGEVDVVARQIDHCFARVAQYLWDVTMEGGNYLYNLTFGGGLRYNLEYAEDGGLSQYMWGTRPGRKEKEVILTDIDPTLEYYDLDETNHNFYQMVVPGLVSMIVGMERRLGSSRLVKAREVALRFLDSIPTTNAYYEEMVALKAKL